MGRMLSITDRQTKGEKNLLDSSTCGIEMTPQSLEKDLDYKAGFRLITPHLRAPPPLEVGLVGCSRLVGGTRQQASLEARCTRAAAGLLRGHFILSEQVSYHQQLTFRLSGHQQQQQKHRLELFFCHRV